MASFVSRIFIVAFVLYFSTGFNQVASAGKTKILFQSDEIMSIRIEGPLRELIRKAGYSTDPYSGTLFLDGDTPETHAIIVSARGKSRRDKNICRFPPLRIEFVKKPDEPSLFDGQKRLKLVTHCKSPKTYQQYYLLEYAVYKLLNVLTPYSHKVRLAEIAYIDENNGKTITTRLGFFIEDTDDVAKRNDLKEIDIKDIQSAQLNAAAAAQYALFQYMIGNLDWSMHQGPPDDDCCHNTKLIGERSDPLVGLIPVAYDFDYSGFVDTNYAVPPETVRVRTVRTRRYRGFCDHNEHVFDAAALFKERRAALEAALAATPALSERNLKRNQKYLDKFFDDIETEDKIQRKLLSTCRD